MQKTPNDALDRLDVAGFKAAQKTPLILILNFPPEEAPERTLRPRFDANDFLKI